MKNKLVVLVGVFVLLFFLSISFVSGFVFAGTVSSKLPAFDAPAGGSKAAQLDGDLAEIREIMGQIAHSYVDDVSKKKLVDGAIEGMIKTLDDPYTRYMKNKDYDSFQEHTSGQFGGVGMELGMRDEHLTVISPIKDTPAAKAGVQAGDIITTIDSTSTKDMPLEKAVKMIRGPMGTKVKLSFERGEDKEKFTRVIVRGQIKVPNVTAKVVDGDLGYITLHAFNHDTSNDVRKELERLKGKNIKGVMVDLRNNPGGLLNEAVDVTSVFVRDQMVVQVKARKGAPEALMSGRYGDTEIPLVLLVNKGSASASEIFAGAVQDLKRGLVVGERTFGKGSVQTVVQLSDGSGLILTTAKYMTPSGRSLNKKGIKPDITVKMPKEDFHDIGKPNDPQILKAKEVLRGLIK